MSAPAAARSRSPPSSPGRETWQRSTAAVDVSRRAVLCTRINARRHGVEVDTLHGDLFEPLAGRRFDLVVSNPPYVPSERPRRPRGAARAWECGEDTCAVLDRICGEVTPRLRPGGAVLLVHSAACGVGITLATLAAAGLEPDVIRRHHGPPGPIAAARRRHPAIAASLGADGLEEVVVVRGRRSRYGAPVDEPRPLAPMLAPSPSSK